MSSQTHLNDSTCCVPCSALKKALIVKNERDYLKEYSNILSDSIKIYKDISQKQDSLNKTNVLKLTEYKDRENTFNNLLQNSNTQVSIYKSKYNTERTNRKISNGITGVVLLVLIIVL